LKDAVFASRHESYDYKQLPGFTSIEKIRENRTKAVAMAFNFFKSFMPTVKAEEEELVDPQQELRAKCAQEDHHASSLLSRYQECNDRVNSRSKTLETCTEELFDYLHALDHCVTKTLFSRLK